MSIIDPHLVRAVQLAHHRRSAFDAVAGDPHDVWQVSSISALLDGRYEGDLTLGELVSHGDLGIGTVQHLDGELIIVDGECFQVTADGSVLRPPPTTRTPFAVITRFSPGDAHELVERQSLTELTTVLDQIAPAAEPVVAARIHGRFDDLRLRSVPRQSPPYPPLTELVAHQTTWSVADATGVVVGFRFPVELQGVEVPGYHLHFLSDDRTIGGHVCDLTLIEGRVQIDASHRLHVETPVGLAIANPEHGAATAEAIRSVEGRAGGEPSESHP